jgi:hypothetical protein
MTYPNDSSTGGYLLPKSQPSEFGNLSFEEFLQTVFVGVSGLPGDLVRPKWQENPPTQPDIGVNWLAIGLGEDDADTFAYNGIDSSGNNSFQRMEALSVQCTFYGPDSHRYMRIVRDGFQIPQNFAALQKANMGFVSTSRGTRVPDLVNERWVNRWEMTAYFRRQDIRTYPILNLVSGSGSLIANNSNGAQTVPITVGEN